MSSFFDAHGAKIKGVLSGFDRVRFRGTKRMLANADGLGCFLHFIKVLLTGFKAWSLDLTQRIRRGAERLVERRGRPNLYVASCHTDKEALARKIADRDGITEGLICVLRCVESCNTFQLNKNKGTKRLELTPQEGRCMHLYFYLMHREFGFMHLRVQTWVPFTVFVNINGREWLANQLRKKKISFEKRDNCFVDVGDIDRAQALLAKQLNMNWTSVLDKLIREYHPVDRRSIFEREPYYWSAEETEWATDVMFRSEKELAALYPSLVRHAVNEVHCQDVLRYLGRTSSVARNRKCEIESSVLTRREGTRVKHVLEGNSVKMYDKQGSLLRIETTINRTRQMKVFRASENAPHGKKKWQRMRKGVADLADRAKASQSVNDRYLDDLASVECRESLGQSLAEPCQPTTYQGRRVRALRPFEPADQALLRAVNDGRFLLNGFRNRDIKDLLFGDRSKSSNTKRGKSQAARVTRQLRILRAHGLIRKIQKSHRYQLTDAGRQTITAILAAQNASTKQLTQLAA